MVILVWELVANIFIIGLLLGLFGLFILGTASGGKGGSGAVQDKELPENYKELLKKKAFSDNRLFVDGFEELGDGTIAENFTENMPGYNGPTRKIVERDPFGKWVKDEYGVTHIRSDQFNDPK